MRRLPPLTAIEAFVQVARLGSVKAAAGELALSSPALSRRVQALERFVGRPLFERRHQAMQLNLYGEQLLARLSPALNAVAEAIEAVTGEGEVLRLRLGVPQLFATQKLIPQLAALRAAHPSLHLDIDSGSYGPSRLGERLDAAITIARDVDPTLYARRLDRHSVVAIAAPSLIAGPNPITEPKDIAHTTVLLHSDLTGNFDDWREAVGLPNLEPLAVDHFDSGTLILEAAAQGLGVAFMLESHLEEANDPRLVRLFDIHAASSYSYWFTCRRSALSRRPVKLFHDWLFATFGKA
jgi:LysR family glycine cleavage system transcriptional activator